MGSLKVLHPTALKQKNNVAVFQIRKPTVLLGVVQKSSDPNHSPLGSPPTEKKRIRRFSNSLQASKAPAGGVQYAEEKENHHAESPPSILKLTTVRPRGLLTQGAPTRCSHKRHVDFNGQVKVQYIGDTDSSFEPLTENSDRQSFIARNALRRMQVQLQQPAFPVYKDNQSSGTTSSSSNNYHSHSYAPEQSSQSSASSTGIPQASSSSASTVLSNTNSPLHSKNVNISFSQTGRNVTTMRFVVFMGPQYDPANIVVKANMSGTRLRVVASLKPARGGASEQYNERFQLPMQVDPYKVEARLDARGFLTVTAPLLEPSPTSVSV